MSLFALPRERFFIPGMKNFILGSLGIPLSLTVLLISYKVLITHGNFGGSSIFALSVLVVWSLFSFISLLLFQAGRNQAICHLWLVIGASFLAFLIGDIVAGYLLIPRHFPRMIPDSVVHHKLPPDSNSEWKKDEYTYTQRVNSLGLRGHEIQAKKDPTTYRILMLGDSFTMGAGVRDEQTFSFLLERSLNSEQNNLLNRSVEVLNAGVNSYTPILSFLQLTKLAPQLQPNLVILNFDMSDLIQEVAYRNAAIYGADGNITGVPGRKREIKEILRGWIDQNLYLTRLALFFLDDWAQEFNEPTIRTAVVSAHSKTLMHTLSGDEVDRKEQWENIFESILKIKNYCENREIRFLLTLYPWGHQVSDKEWLSGRTRYIPEDAVVSDKSVHLLEDFASHNNIALLNVFPAFRSYKGESSLYYNYDMHWTPMGHKVMSRQLGQFIKTTYFSLPNQE